MSKIEIAIDDLTYAEILIINKASLLANFKFFIHNISLSDSDVEGDLGILCSNFETFLCNIDNFIDKTFWNKENHQIIKEFIHFRSKQAECDWEDVESNIFNDIFFKCLLPFNSEFMDQNVLIGYIENDILYIKKWNYFLPDDIIDIKIEINKIKRILSEIINVIYKIK